MARLVVTLAVVSSLGFAQNLLLTTHTFDPLQGEPVLPQELRAPDPRADEEAYYLIQLRGPVTEHAKEGLSTKGARLLGYIPEYAFLARMTPQAASAIRSLPDVRWVGLYHPAYKIDPTIGTHRFTHPDRVADPRLWLVVRVHAPEDPLQVAALLEAMGAEVEDVVTEANKRVLVRLPRERLFDIARLPQVLYIWEQGEYFLHNNITRWVVQSNQTGVTSIWDHGIHGENQLITIMDSGVDWQSCFFRDPEGDPIGPNHRKIQSYVTYGQGQAYDKCTDGHGSHVAGTALGQDFTLANSQYNGMAYAARLAVQDIGRDQNVDCLFGYIYPPTSLTTAFTNARNLGSYVHSNSWGGQQNQYEAYAEDVDEFMWGNRDFLVLFAMGNAGPNPSTIGYPATAKNCVSVGGTQQAPTQHHMYGLSSRGPCYDGRRKPDVCAPACGVNGQAPHITSCDNHPNSSPTCAVANDIWQGTSMATPAVAGCAALVRQYFLEGYHPTGTPVPGHGFTPSAALVKAMLIASGRRMTGSGVSDYPDNNQGWGRVLLEDVLYFVGDQVGLDVVDHTSGLTTGGTYTRQVPIGSSQPARFVLVWTDPPKTPPANPALVNNLDLVVTDPAGNTYLGNVFSGGQSVPGGTADNLNNVEVVHRDSPVQGQWTIRVIGTNVPTGPQPFALVVRGAGLNVPVELGSFQGRYEPQRRAVVLEWVTASEENNLGFHVERSTEPHGPYVRLTGDLIPGAGTSATPHVYSYVDDQVGPGTYYYRLIQVDVDGRMTTHGPLAVVVAPELPRSFALGSPVPNPFGESVTIPYQVPERAHVTLAVYDLQGRLVRTLVDGAQEPAYHATNWDGRDASGARVSQGSYVCRLMAEGFVASRPLVVVR